MPETQGGPWVFIQSPPWPTPPRGASRGRMRLVGEPSKSRSGGHVRTPTQNTGNLLLVPPNKKSPPAPSERLIHEVRPRADRMPEPVSIGAFDTRPAACRPFPEARGPL